MEAVKRIEELVRELLRLVGEDPNREGLTETPSRVARMWVEELTTGYRVDPGDVFKYFDAGGDYEKHGDLVVVKDIPVRSLCEHHLLPFFGLAHIAYIPNDKVVGFSKLARVVDVFSRRLQVQERLTDEVADFLFEKLTPKGLMVIVEAYHTCTIVRGVKERMYIITQATKGLLSEGSRRVEVLMLLNLARNKNLLNIANYPDF